MLSAILLVVVVLAVGVVVVLGSIDRLKHPPRSEARPAVGSPGASHLAQGSASPGRQALLRDGNFESGTPGSVRAAQGSDMLVVPGGAHSSTYSARLTTKPGVSGAGLLADQVTRPPGRGNRYSATAVVRTSRPGLVVQIQLVESVGGRRVSFDPQIVRLQDTLWREISVQHEISNNGSVLGVEVTFLGLGRGQYGYVDDLKVVQTL